MRGRIFSLFVDSEIELPVPAALDPSLVDIVIVRGAVEPRGDLLWRSQAEALPFQAFADGSAIVLDWLSHRFHVTAERIVVDAANVDATLFFQPVWSVVLTLRGYTPLHGAAVERDGRAFALLGASGSGKSTAVAGLLDRGWRLVTDDLLIVTDDLRVIPGPPCVRLNPDSARGRTGVPTADGKIRVAAVSCPRPVPLAAVVILDSIHPALTILNGGAAVAGLLNHLYNPFPIHRGEGKQRLAMASAIAQAASVRGAPPRLLTAREVEAAVREEIECAIACPVM